MDFHVNEICFELAFYGNPHDNLLYILQPIDQKGFGWSQQYFNCRVVIPSITSYTKGTSNLQNLWYLNHLSVA